VPPSIVPSTGPPLPAPPQQPPGPPPLPQVPPVSGVSSISGHAHSGGPASSASVVPPQLPPIPISASSPSAPGASLIVQFLSEIKQTIEDTATLLQTAIDPAFMGLVTIPDFVDDKIAHSANIRATADTSILAPVNIILDKFSTLITRKNGELDTLLKRYNNSKQPLLDNIDHCTDDATIRDEIRNKGLEQKIVGIKAKYDGYVDAARGYRIGIQNEIREINDTGIDQPAKQATCKTLFETIQTKCNEYADYITERMPEVETDVDNLTEEVNTYTTVTIPDLEGKLLACIQGELKKLTIQFDADLAEIKPKLQELTTTFDKGSKLIDEIGGLLQQLK
jgi:hypothetical protein